MDRKSLFLSLGIAYLFLVYILFTPQQYFSPAAMLSLGIVTVCGLLLILLPYFNRFVEGRGLLFLKLISILSMLLLLYEAYYDAAYGMLQPAEGYTLIAALLSTLVIVAALHFVIRREPSGKIRWPYTIAILALVVVVVFAIQAYTAYAIHWIGTDELAYNYFAASLLLHGVNPYTASMAPILVLNSIYPTLTMNGGCSCSYDYPALSFLVLLPESLLSYQDFIYFAVLVKVALAVFISFLLYRKSGSPYSILPIAAWLVALGYLGASHIIVISALLMLAYIYRQRILLSSALLGLAASLHQLSWIALPFFFVLTLREYGRLNALKSIGIVVALFLLINGYFIIASPQMPGEVLGLFSTKLQFSGLSAMQLLMMFYQVPYWYSLFATVAVLAVSLALFYLYTDTLRPLIAFVPALVSFLSWRNLPGYTITFIPLLIAIYYLGRNDNVKDKIHDRRALYYVPIILLVLLTVSLLYTHGAYLGSAAFKVTQVRVLAGINQNGTYALAGLYVNVTNLASEDQNLSFYIVSRSPANFGTYGHVTLLPAGGYNDYLLNYSLDSISDSTEIYVFTMSDGYMTRTGVNTNH